MYNVYIQTLQNLPFYFTERADLLCFQEHDIVAVTESWFDLNVKRM